MTVLQQQESNDSNSVQSTRQFFQEALRCTHGLRYHGPVRAVALITKEFGQLHFHLTVWIAGKQVFVLLGVEEA